MKTLLFNPASIVTVDSSGKNYKRGRELSEIGCLYDHSIIIEYDLIKDILPTSSLDKNKFEKIIDLTGKTVLPGLVECHTHTAFAGSRADEFRQKLNGVSYEEIAQRGGGINTTVEAVRSTSFEDLVNIIKPRIEHFISQGITTLEIKSGYGLNFENERKIVGTTDGYRVQVLSTDDIDEANRIRAEVYEKTTKKEVYVIFEPPFYKVKVGDFTSKSEADNLRFNLNQLGYTESKVVQETVNLFE